LSTSAARSSTSRWQTDENREPTALVVFFFFFFFFVFFVQTGENREQITVVFDVV
jgi:hypothetical protein